MNITRRFADVAYGTTTWMGSFSHAAVRQLPETSQFGVLGSSTIGLSVSYPRVVNSRKVYDRKLVVGGFPPR